MSITHVLRIAAAILVLTIAAALAPAQAEEVPQRTAQYLGKTGNQLYGVCDARPAPAIWQHCLDYVAGAVDEATVLAAVMVIGSEKYGHKDVSDFFRVFRICLPDNKVDHKVDIEQVADVVVKYLREHPERRDQMAASLVFEAVHDAWPCKMSCAPPSPAGLSMIPAASRALAELARTLFLHLKG
jgi:Rap1a immunity proteins